jgi:hypothetical protein
MKRLGIITRTNGKNHAAMRDVSRQRAGLPAEPLSLQYKPPDETFFVCWHGYC